MAEENSILTEIKQDIQAEKYQRIFLEHGHKLIAAGVAIVVLTGAMSIYNNMVNKRSRASGTEFMQAFDEQDMAKYDDVIKNGQKGYAPLAGLIKAGIMNSGDKSDDALKALDSVANDSSFDEAFRQKATIDKIYILMQKKGDKAEILKLFDTVTGKDAVFQSTAQELKASYLLETGDKKAAKDVLIELSNNERAPATLQDRAKHLLATLND